MSKQYPFTVEEVKAIVQLKRAFTKCKRLGLKFAGMDNDLYVCNKRVYEWAKENRSDDLADYNEVAYAIKHRRSGADTLLTGGDPYIESAGW